MSKCFYMILHLLGILSELAHFWVETLRSLRNLSFTLTLTTSIIPREFRFNRSDSRHIVEVNRVRILFRLHFVKFELHLLQFISVLIRKLILILLPNRANLVLSAACCGWSSLLLNGSTMLLFLRFLIKELLKVLVLVLLDLGKRRKCFLWFWLLYQLLECF